MTRGSQERPDAWIKALRLDVSHFPHSLLGYHDGYPAHGLLAPGAMHPQVAGQQAIARAFAARFPAPQY